MYKEYIVQIRNGEKNMKNFTQCPWKRMGLFLFFSFNSVVVFAMNSPVISNDLSLKPDKIMTIFDPKKELELGRPWNEVVPGNMMITPDGKGVVIGDCGRVRYAQFDREYDIYPETIIEHSRVKHSPMIGMSQKNDGSLLVVSAGNYINVDKKRVAEYIMFCNGSSHIKKIDWPIQAISLDSCGKILAIARRDSVTVIDLETGKNAEVYFKGSVFDKNIWIVDIAIHAKGNSIIATGSQGGVQLMALSKKDQGDINLSILTQVMSGDSIEKIYYSSLEELLYVTHDGKAKIIATYNLLENDQENVQTTVFAAPSSCNMAIADSGEHIATAHWNNNRNVREDIRRKIKVYRKGMQCIEKFVLEVPQLEDRYDYITELGQCGLGVGHLLHVALCDKCVAVLATDGKIRVWSLPEKNVICNEAEKKELGFHEKLAELQTASRSRDEKEPMKRNRSSSEKVRRQNLIISGDAVELGEKKKVSPRFIHLISRGSHNSSKENSPVLSRESSPHRVERSEGVTFATDVKENKTPPKNCEDKNII